MWDSKSRGIELCLATSATTRERLAGGCRLQPLGEELERLARLRLLLAAKVYATSGEKGPSLCSDLERLARSALGRELEDPRSVGIQPHLGDHPAIERFRGELQLEHEDRSENGQVVEREALRGVLVAEGPLLPREQPLQPPFPEDGLANVRLRRPLHRAGADESSRHHVDLDAELARPAHTAWKLRRDNGPELHDGVVALPLHATGTSDHAPARRASGPACRRRTLSGSGPPGYPYPWPLRSSCA